MILASKNKGKIIEFKEILAKFNIEVISLLDLNFNEEIVEDGTTFEENALIKAKTIYEIYHLPVISDDSGLCVFALNGAPGVYSARYGGVETDLDRTNLVLKHMEGITNREAYFHCSIVLYLEDGNYKHFEGRVYGDLDYEVKGENGFGYDVIFIPKGYNDTFGIISSDIKNEISHRANALKSLVSYLENDFNN